LQPLITKEIQNKSYTYQNYPPVSLSTYVSLPHSDLFFFKLCIEVEQAFISRQRMYKRFSLEELSTIQNNFIPHLYKYIQQERCQGVNDFFKFAFREGNEVFYFERGNVAFKVALENNTFSLTDEVDKIQVQIPADHK